MVHSHAEQAQSPFAKERVIHGHGDESTDGKETMDDQRQELAKDSIEGPLVAIEKAVVPDPGTSASGTTGNNHIADKSSPLR